MMRSAVKGKKGQQEERIRWSVSNTAGNCLPYIQADNWRQRKGSIGGRTSWSGDRPWDRKDTYLRVERRAAGPQWASSQQQDSRLEGHSQGLRCYFTNNKQPLLYLLWRLLGHGYASLSEQKTSLCWFARAYSKLFGTKFRVAFKCPQSLMDG